MSSPVPLLPLANPLSGTEQFYAVQTQSGVPTDVKVLASQITGGVNAGLPIVSPTVNDTVIGIDSGLTVQFPVTSIGFIPANGNVTLYVRVGGSDSNPGTLARPFATVQRAANVASFYNYQGLYWPTIDIGVGTFLTNATNAILPPELRNATFPTGIAVFGNGLGVIRGDSTSTTTIDDSVGQGCFFCIGSTSAWVFNNLNLDSDVGCLNAEEGALITSQFGGAIKFSNTHGSDNPGEISAVSGGTVIIDQCTVTYNDINCGPLINLSSLAFYGNSSGTIGITNSTINLPSSSMTFSTGQAFVNTGNIGGTVSFVFNTVNNATSWLGTTVNLGGPGSSPTTISTDDGTFNFIPGTGITNIDNSVVVQSASLTGNSTRPRFGVNPIGTFVPTTNSLAPFQWGTFRTTSSGGSIRVSANNGGTIIETVLGPIPGLVSALPAAGTKGRRAIVTDATVTTFASIVAGTGGNIVPVYDDGTNWRIG